MLIRSTCRLLFAHVLREWGLADGTSGSRDAFLNSSLLASGMLACLISYAFRCSTDLYYENHALAVR